MLNDEDIKKLIKVFATRGEIILKTDWEDMKKDFSNLQSAIDAYMKKTENYHTELTAIKNAINRREDWIKTIS